MPTVSFHTLGCKLNFAETSTIARQLKEAGYQKVEFEHSSDVVVVNTCSVTENADKECRTIVRRALQINPQAFIAIIGCYAQLKPEEIAKIEGVDLVLGATEKFNLPVYLKSYTKKNGAEIHSCAIEDADQFVASYSAGDRTRSFLKVQDGCDYSCTYCTIPLARGKSRSAEISEVVDQAREIGLKGIKEIVLTGVNIGDFGFSGIENKKKNTFLELITALDTVESVGRFRISSIEPNLLSEEIIRFVATSKRFASHFHIPLQSGSDKILRLMRRRYLRELYTRRIQDIRSVMPYACIGVDVIVGFPGETENDFNETYTFIQNLDVNYLHVFTYSERPNTEAIEFKGVVPLAERKKRNQMLRILSEKKRQDFYRSQLGRSVHVIFEDENVKGMMQGFTENYVKVRMPYEPEWIHQSTEVILTNFDGSNCVDALPAMATV